MLMKRSKTSLTAETNYLSGCLLAYGKIATAVSFVAPIIDMDAPIVGIGERVTDESDVVAFNAASFPPGEKTRFPNVAPA